MTPTRPFLCLVALLVVAGFALWLTGCAGKAESGKRKAEMPPLPPGMTATVNLPRISSSLVVPPSPPITYAIDFPVHVPTPEPGSYVRWVGMAVTDGTELSRVKVTEPTGLIAIIGYATNGNQIWWYPKAWSNINQTVTVTITNTGESGTFKAFTSNQP